MRFLFISFYSFLCKRMTPNVTQSNFGGSRFKKKQQQLISTTWGCFHTRPVITIEKKPTQIYTTWACFHSSLSFCHFLKDLKKKSSLFISLFKISFSIPQPTSVTYPSYYRGSWFETRIHTIWGFFNKNHNFSARTVFEKRF